MKSPTPVLGALVAWLAIANCAAAQFQSQTIELLPGWNAVHLEVTPDNDDPDTVFSGLAVEAVWQFVPRTRVAKFIDDPAALIPESPDWLVYFPPSSASRAVSGLHALDGGTCYLIKLGGATAQNLTVTGKPAIRDRAWQGDAYNLVGFTVDATAPPTFSEFFASSPAHAGQAVYRLNNATGRFESASDSTDMRRGEAFWTYTNGESLFQGPYDVDSAQGRSLDFSTDIASIRVSLTNSTNVGTTMTLTLVQSAPTPAGSSQPLVAGEVPMSRWQAISGPSPEFSYVPFTTTDIFVPAKAIIEVDLAVRRGDMTPFTYPAGKSATYQSLLHVTTDAGTLTAVPVSSSGPATVAGTKSLAKRIAASPLETRHGLWVGTAAISKVSEAAAFTDKVTPKPTLSEFQFPIIVHVDASNNAKLLQQVYLMYKPAVQISDPQAAGYTIVGTPGRYVLVTDESLLSQFQGVQVVDNRSVGRRISTAAFSFATPQAMALSGSRYSCDVTLDYDDPQNPFKHKYHNFHDNLNASFTGVLPEGVESYTVTRRVELDFSSTVPDDFSGAGFGDTVAAGVYREEITGLHREKLYVEGTFRISNVSSVEVLNDGI